MFFVKPGETVSIEVYASDNEDNQVIIDFAKALPNFTTIRDNGDGSATIEISPTAGDSGRKVYADVEASDDQSSELKSISSFRSKTQLRPYAMYLILVEKSENTSTIRNCRSTSFWLL
jgi:hypothetical protein